MIGLMFFGTIGLWIMLVHWLMRWLFSKEALLPSNRTLRIVLPVLFWCFVLPLPVADEIIGGFQLRALCKKSANFIIDVEKIKGKTVGLMIDPSGKYLLGTIIPIRYSRYSYRDVLTREEYVSFNVYTAEAGKIWGWVGLSDHPIVPVYLSTDYPSCPFPDMGSAVKLEDGALFYEQYGFTRRTEPTFFMGGAISEGFSNPPHRRMQ
jgi:hypothetical protein